MDQVKTLFRALSKHGFWIGCGLILVVSMFSWYTARGSLQSEFTENLGKIKTSFQSANTLKTKPSPPNEHSNAAMDRVINEAHELVLQAWEKQYSRQEMILRWPQELGENFIAAVRPLKPIELKVEPNTVPEPLKVDHRQLYANYVERLLPKLAELINSRWTPGRPAATMEGSGMVPGTRTAGPVEKPPLVIWDGQDQARLLAMHFDWSKQPDSAPTTLQVLYAQEDLWVLTALMYIINKTNGDIEARHEAVVKTIESVMIGRSAVGRAGQVILLGGRNPMLGGSMPAGMGEGYPMDGESSAEMGSYSSSETGSGAVAGTGTSGTETGSATSDYPSDSMGGVRMMPGVAMDPANYRYVDNEYHPLPAQRVREAMRAGTPEDAFLVVAKRMPIRLRLIVDQRKLHRLLAEFGNSALPVEIRQVRVNRAGSSGGGMMGGYGGGSYGSSYGGGYSEEMGSYGGGMGEMMGAGSSGGYDYGSESETGYGMPTPQYGSEEGYGMGGMTYGGDYGSTTGADIKDRKEVSSTTNYDVPVEVYGIIYIYNPVDEQKLGIEQPPSHAGVTPTNTVTAG